MSGSRLVPIGSQARIFVAAIQATSLLGTVSAAPCNIAETAKLTASDAGRLDNFGIVAIDGDTAVVGAMNAGNSGSFYGAGAAYVFRFDGTNWVLVATLTSSDLARDDEFGARVAIDRRTIVIAAPQDDDGASDSGSAYVFEEPPEGWASAASPITETAKLTASDPGPGDVFGSGLDVSDGTIVVGALNDDDLGSDSGSAYTFEAPSGGWSSVPSPIHETAKLMVPGALASDRFGRSVAVFEGTLAVGADQNGVHPGAVYVFERHVGTWAVTAVLTASDGSSTDNFGISVAVTEDLIAVGAYAQDGNGTNAGAAYVFEKPVGGWVDMTETGKLTASDAVPGDNLGLSVAIRLDGLVAVGAFAANSGRSGFVYLYSRPASGWGDVTESFIVTASDAALNDRFGGSVAISDNHLIVGAVRADHEGGTDAGAAYVYDMSGCTVSICGDGLVSESESCDDSNTFGGDGCSPTCLIEPGFTCTGEPSSCAPANAAPTCGIGILDSVECQGGTTPVELDGTASSDPDVDDVLSYAWMTNCPGGMFNDATSASPTLFVDTSFGCSIACSVDLTVTDGSEASDICSTAITIVDTEAPTLGGVPVDTSLECDAVPSPAPVQVVDGCDSNPALDFTEAVALGLCPQASVITRNWDVSDACGNAASATQVITVVDSTPPVLTGVPDDMVVECDAVPVPPNVTASDNCDQCLPTYFSEVQTGICSLTLTRTWEVTDACGNSTTEIQAILVQDTTPPTATAELTLISSGDNESGSQSSGDHDDDEGIFVVNASCSDNCAGIGGCAVPVLTAVLECSNGMSANVAPGEMVEIELDDEGDCEIEMEDGRLEIEGDVSLIVTCTDGGGNVSTATAIPVGLAPDNDTDADDDD